MRRYIYLSAKIYKAKNIKAYRHRVAFILRSMVNNVGMKKLIEFFNESPFRNDIAKNYPFVFEQATRPFFYRNATFLEKVTFIKEHNLFLEKRFTEEALRSVYLGEGLTLWSTDYQNEILSLRLHFQESQKKEGLVVIELKIGEVNIYQIVFWIASDETGENVLWIGALQGLSGGTKIIRDLTKYFFGYRPKNFILHAVRIFTYHLGIDKIYAVSNYGFHDSTLHPHKQKLKTSLDNFWQETGGIACNDPRFFELPVVEHRKRLDEVESHKRNLYRKRFAMIDAISIAMTKELELCLIDSLKDEFKK